MNEVIEPSVGYSLVTDSRDKETGEEKLAVLFTLKKCLYAEIKNIKSHKGSCEGHMIFPYYTKGSYLAFLYRTDSEYDAYSTKIKEVAAVVLNKLLRPIYKRKKIWLVYEKFCSMAQDNGY